MADFTLTLPYVWGNAYAGQEVPILVDISGVDFTDSITLSLSGIPNGSVVTYFPGNPVNVYPGRDFHLQIGIRLPLSDMIVGNYDIVVSALSEAV